EPSVDFVPVGDVLLTKLPAEEHEPVVLQGVEVDQAFLEALEQAADRLELLEVAVDPERGGGHSGPERLELLAAFFRFGSGGGALERRDGCAPGCVFDLEVGEDSADERQ